MRRSELMSIDVVMPAYNASKYIIEALNSVVEQTFLPARILVVDDGSSDNTVSLVSDFALRVKDKCEVLCIRQNNSGPSAARNVGLRMVNADYVALLDADDKWHASKLEKQLNSFLSAGRELGLVYCDFSLMNEEGREVENHGFQLNRAVRGNVARQLRYANQIAGSASAVLIRKDVLDEIGLFDESLVCAEDWDLWLRIADRYHVDFVDEPLVQLRQHPRNSQNNEQRMLGGELRFAQKQFSSGRLPWVNIVRLGFRIAQARRNGLQIAHYAECHFVLRFVWSPKVIWLQYQAIRGFKGIRRRLRELRNGSKGAGNA